MSLAIQTDRACAVLLSDGWHEVEEHSFDIGDYGYRNHEEYPIVRGGPNHLISSAAFTFQEVGFPAVNVCGPLTAIQAVRTCPNS